MEELDRIRDLTIELFLRMDDKTLFNMCLANKEINKICNDENLWRKKFLNKYGEENAKYKPEYYKWKRYYLLVTTLLENNEPYPFSKYISMTRGDTPDKLFYSWKNIPIKYAPEPLKIVYRMKKFPEFKRVKYLDFDGDRREWKSDKELTLEEFFSSLEVPKESYVEVLDVYDDGVDITIKFHYVPKPEYY